MADSGAQIVLDSDMVRAVTEVLAPWHLAEDAEPLTECIQSKYMDRRVPYVAWKDLTAGERNRYYTAARNDLWPVSADGIEADIVSTIDRMRDEEDTLL